jgi:serine phosphatase RsbU (regulator of sigma subunit)
MFTYAAAGHQGFLMKEDGRVVQLEATGIPLGIEPHTNFPSSAAISLHTGDILVLLTDGVEEAMSPQQRVFGLERAFDVVRAKRDQSAKEIVAAIFDAAREFGDGEPQADDITSVVIKAL